GREGGPGLQVLADQLVFLQELGEVAAREVARAPLLHDPEPEPVGMRFLAHLLALFLLGLAFGRRRLRLGTLALGGSLGLGRRLHWAVFRPPLPLRRPPPDRRGPGGPLVR